MFNLQSDLDPGRLERQLELVLRPVMPRRQQQSGLLDGPEPVGSEIKL